MNNQSIYIFGLVIIFTLVSCSSVNDTVGKYRSNLVDFFKTPVKVKHLKPAAQEHNNIRTIAVVKVEGNKGEHAKAILIDRLQSTKRFAVVNRSDFDKALEEITFSQSSVVDPKTAKRLGKIYGADALVIGKVEVKYRNEKKTKRNESSTTYTKKGVATTEGALALLDLETGKYLAYQNVTTQKVSKKSETDGWPEDVDQASLVNLATTEGVMLFIKQVSPYYETSEVFFERTKTDHGKKGVKFIKEGLYQEGLRFLSLEAQEKPSHASSWYNLGIGLELNNRFIESRKALDKCLEIKTKDRYIQALIKLTQNEKDYAIVKNQFDNSGLSIQ